MSIREQRRRVLDAFCRAGLAELDKAAKDRGFTAPLPSDLVADGLRERGRAVVARMDDATIRKLSDAPDEVLEAAFAGIARDGLRETLC